jgi:hypothetical protein
MATSKKGAPMGDNLLTAAVKAVTKNSVSTRSASSGSGSGSVSTKPAKKKSAKKSGGGAITLEGGTIAGGGSEGDDNEEEFGLSHTYEEDTAVARMARLKKHKEELILRIHSIDMILAEEGIPVSYSLDSIVPRHGIHATRTTQTNPSSGIRINNELSFRGKQKAGEYFDRLDEDHDGYLTFDDFRAMISLTNADALVSDSTSSNTSDNVGVDGAAGKSSLNSNYHYRNWEAWRLYMDDLGVKTDMFGRMDKEGFIKYRSRVELSLPLSKELEKLGLPLLPRELAIWQQMKGLIQDIYRHRKLTHLGVSHQHSFNPRLDLNDVAFILANLSGKDISTGAEAARIYTREEFIDMMKESIGPYQLCMTELLDVSFRKHYATSNDVFQYILEDEEMDEAGRSGGEGQGPARRRGRKRGEASDNTEADILKLRIKNLIYISPAQLIAWYFSKRSGEIGANIDISSSGERNSSSIISRSSPLYRQLIQLKQRTLHTWRHIDYMTRVLFDASMAIRLRMIYRQMKPMEKIITKESKTFAQLNCLVGNKMNQVNDGIGIHWNLTKLSNPEEYYSKYRLPKDCGTAISLELSLRSEIHATSTSSSAAAATSRIQAKRAADALVIFVRSHFEEELKTNLQYRGLSVNLAENESDGAQVIRISIAFKRIVSIDAMLEYCFIPYALHELVPECSGSLRTSLNIFDILHATSVSLDTSFTCQFLARVTYVRQEVLAVLYRTILAFSSSIFGSELLDPDEANKVLDREDQREFKLWSQFKNSTSNLRSTIVNLCKSFYSTFSGMKKMSFSYQFKSITECIQLLRMDNLTVLQLFPIHLVAPPSTSSSSTTTTNAHTGGGHAPTTPTSTNATSTSAPTSTSIPTDIGNYLNSCWNAWKAKFIVDLQHQYERLKVILEENVIAQEKECTRLLMGLISSTAAADNSSSATSKQDLLTKLEELGIKSSATDFIDEDSENYKELFHEWESINQDRDVQAMIMYERVWHACSGIHSLEIVTGKSRLAATCQGLEIFELLPKPPSLHAVKEACDKKTRKHHKKAN